MLSNFDFLTIAEDAHERELESGLLDFVASAQIDFVGPGGTALGPATVAVNTTSLIVATGSVMIESVAPGPFTANGGAQAVPSARTISVAA